MNTQEEIEMAKKTYEQRKGIVVKELKPVYLKSVAKNSDVFFRADGRKVALYKFGQNDCDFVLMG